jgi:hypothetical protein
VLLPRLPLLLPLLHLPPPLPKHLLQNLPPRSSIH